MAERQYHSMCSGLARAPAKQHPASVAIAWRGATETACCRRGQAGLRGRHAERQLPAHLEAGVGGVAALRIAAVQEAQRVRPLRVQGIQVLEALQYNGTVQGKESSEAGAAAASQ